ncbi:MAG: ATP-grasp domain-containing protein [Clostridiales bacterium]|nr:ATP-grasp domain-containing protein [Candidatus Cacconaster stercorequi]
MENKKEQTVVVLSRNYSTGLSVIRSLGAAGYTVDLVASAHKAGTSEIAAASKYIRKSVEVVSKKVGGGQDTELVLELLKYAGMSDEKIVLFPTDDYTASIMDQYRNLLEDIFIMPSVLGGGDGSITRLMDKTIQGEMARKAGLLTPQEWIISLEKGVEIPEDMVYPCFVKPIESVTGYKREMAKCENKAELFAHLAKLRNKFANRQVLVQEFLNIDNEIDLGGVCLDQQIIIPAIIRKTNVAQYEKGVTLAGRVAPFEELDESVRRGIVDMLRQFRYTGMFDMELNIVGDKIYFNEVNLRSGGPNYSYFKSGVNLPALFVKEALGEGHTPEEERVTSYGKQFIYEKIAWEDYLHGFMTKDELDACIANADITLLTSEDDPAPGEIFARSIQAKARKMKILSAKTTATQTVKDALDVVKPPLRQAKHLALHYPQTKAANQRHADASKPRVMVMGRNYCSNLCMAKSLGEAGYEVEILRMFQTRPKPTNIMKRLQPDAYSRYVKAFYICVAERETQRYVERLIQLADRNSKMLLIPACDLAASVIDENYDELSKYYLMPSVRCEQGAINRLMEKGVQKELARQAGLPILNSCVITAYKGEFDIPDTVNYPCFIKPNVSKNSAKSKMQRCNSREELEKALIKLSRSKEVEMLVEDYVEIRREFSLLGLSTPDGVVGPGFFVAEEGGQAEHRGVAVVGRMLPCEPYWKELIDKLIHFMEQLQYNGLYDIDLVQALDGTMYFVEVNLRYGASGYAVTKCGVNLPGMFADYMLQGKPIDMNCKLSKTGQTFVSEKVLIDEYATGRLSMEKLQKILDSADICFIRDVLDPKPYEHFKKFYSVAGARRIRDEAEGTADKVIRKIKR